METSAGGRQYLFWALVTACVVGLLPGPAAGQAAVNGTLLISEFRLRGPAHDTDEFLEIYNNTNAPHTVTALSGTGYGVAASDGVTRCTIPNGTVIPARGHFLCASIDYFLYPLPAGNGTTATGDATYTMDIPLNAGIALFNNNTGGVSYSLANRIDAVGSSTETNIIYKEGTGYPALTGFVHWESSFTRLPAGGCTGSAAPPTGNCPNVALIKTTPGPASTHLQDTNDNASDFIYVSSPYGQEAGAGVRSGAPGPENLTSPVSLDGFDLAASRLDPCRHRSEAPNWVRKTTGFIGVLDLRHTFTNTTSAAITRLRFRIIDITTTPSIPGVADLRPIGSSDLVVSVDRPPCGTGTTDVTVRGTIVEEPFPITQFGTGFNLAMSVNAISAGTPLAAGASVDVRFLMNVFQTGEARFCVAAETLPAAGSQVFCAMGHTGMFRSTDALTIHDFGAAAPYPSNIIVSGLTGTITRVTVELKSMSHTFPDDIDVLLVSPTGVKLVLMSDVLQSSALTGQTYLLDSTASDILPDHGPAPPSGVVRPTNVGDDDSFPVPAPAGPYLNPAPAGTATLAVFNGLEPNGKWSLYVVDDAAGDSGTIAGGWTLSITTSSGAVTSDFNGNGASDIAIFRPSTGEWHVRNQPTAVWGVAGDIPVAGDYNGDGLTDRAVYRPSTGEWHVQNQATVVWGVPGDIPVPADFLGAGSVQRAVYRPSTGGWFVENRPEVVWGIPGDVPVPGDYNGDLMTDFAVYRPSTGAWLVQGQTAVVWGVPGDVAVPADYDGDGTTDVAVYRPSTGHWLVRGQAAVTWGLPGDIPVPADYNGDGAADIAVFRPSIGAWLVPGQPPVVWGLAGDLPMPRPETWGDLIVDGASDVAGYLADFDGNGMNDIAVYRVSTATWFTHGQPAVVWGVVPGGGIPVPGDYNGGASAERAVYQPSSGAWFVQNQSAVIWGVPGDIPVPGDYDGNGKHDVAVYRPSTGEWFVQSVLYAQWGLPGDVPVPADYDGDGTFDVAVYRPSTGMWFVHGQPVVQWGLPGDVPIPGDFDGNGTYDIAVYRPSSGVWYLRNSATVQWGLPGDLPVPGDFDGNGTFDIAVYRPSIGVWYVRNGITVQWGTPGDIPASRAYVPR